MPAPARALYIAAALGAALFFAAPGARAQAPALAGGPPAAALPTPAQAPAPRTLVRTRTLSAEEVRQRAVRAAPVPASTPAPAAMRLPRRAAVRPQAVAGPAAAPRMRAIALAPAPAPVPVRAPARPLFQVEANRTAPLRLEGDAASIVVGDDRVADIETHDARLLFVTGREPGRTNLMAFDAAGQALFDGEIEVVRDTSALVTVDRGGERASYSCAPVCQPDVR